MAIKVLPERLRRDPERMARLEREARLLAALNHPHVATLHGLEEAEDGTRFLVMELVEGETLAARLGRGALPLGDLYHLGGQIAEALAAAHERGIVHRDLKPDNVMLTDSGVKLLDFGLAREAEPPVSGPHAVTRTMATEAKPLTGEGALVGTVRYMAPEQLEGQRADARSDLWALGVLLHEMATGRPAFEGRSPASLIAAILEREPPSLRDAQPLAPAPFEHLVSSCMVKDPGGRRESAREPRQIGGVHSRAEYASGHLVYWDQGLLVARPFDSRRLVFTGDPFVLGETSGSHQARTGMAIFSVANNGPTLAYGHAKGTRELRWFGRNGRAAGGLGGPGSYFDFRIAPTGDRVAIEAQDRRSGNNSISVFDVGRGVGTPVVAGPGSDGNPVWSPDGSRLAYTSDGAGPPRIYIGPADGGGEPVLLCCEEKLTAYVEDWSPEGELILFESFQENIDLYLVSLEGETTPRLYAGGPGHEVDGRFSPDGRWVAFGSSGLGRMEVWVAPLVDGSAKKKVSAAGGHNPAWSRDGTELYYADEDTLYAVPFSPQTGTLGAVQTLFSLDAPLAIRAFDVAPDGDRFLVAVEDRQRSRSAIRIVLNWTALAE